MRQALVILLMLAILIIGGCKSEPESPPEASVTPVKTVMVDREALAIPVHTSGRLYPKSMVKLSFKTGGLIDRLYVEEGDVVKKGQLLAVLDLSEIDARHSQARNGFLKAKRDLQRAENLYKDRAATLEQLQNAKTAFEVAESNVTIAAFNRDHSRITAPARGKILKRLSEAGEMTGPGTPIFIFGSLESRWVVKAGVSERDIVRIAMGDTAEIGLDAYPGRMFAGEVTEISQAIDPASGTYEVEMAVTVDEALKPAAGFTAKVRITPSERESYYVIPVDAIVEGEGDEGVVFTVRNNRAVKVNIVTAHLFPATVAVVKGLEDVDRVVTVGAAYLTDGAAVKINH